MKKTFITHLPDRAGAFLAASRVISGEGANIARVSYNKAVDIHTLFLDVAGTEEQLDRVAEALTGLGYIQDGRGETRVMLVCFTLRDVPGAVLPILELVRRYDFNISYISSQGDGTGTQDFKMGLLVEDASAVKRFLDEAARLCPVRVIEYDESERVLDNTVFYIGFVNQVSQKLRLSYDQAREVMFQSNLIMQALEERQEPPTRAFEYINRYVDALVACRGERFQPRVSRFALSDGFELTCVEPDCGSDTWILRKDDALLFIDTGFASCAGEMSALLHRLFPDFDRCGRVAVVTHPDIDHCGLLGWFDRVYVTRDAQEHFRRENAGEPNFRELNPRHAPYVRLTRIFSGYTPPRLDTLQVVDGAADDGEPICYCGSIDFRGRKLDFYRGNGGHAVGECAIVDEVDRLVFSGDIMVNIDGYTPPQAAFNRLAPYLMTSVNLDSRKAVQERVCLKKRFDPARYRYCCGHGRILLPEGDPLAEQAQR